MTTTTSLIIRRTGRLAAVCLATALAATGAEAASTWNLSSGCTEATANAGTFGNTFNCSAGAGAPTLAATAVSDTASGSAFATANLAQYSGSGFGVRNQIETLGVASPTTPTSVTTWPPRWPRPADTAKRATSWSRRSGAVAPWRTRPAPRRS